MSTKFVVGTLRLEHDNSKAKLASDLRYMVQRVELAIKALEEGAELDENLVQNMMGTTRTIARYNMARQLLPYFDEPVADVATQTKKRKITREEIAKFYNEKILPKQREDFQKEFNQEPDGNAFNEVRAADLDVRKDWACETSPTRFCVYIWERLGEYCLFCGAPEERK